ncbi:hypothetical protein BHYA_0231g00070 [Botrytis hyacinthi]|uniref:Uncharacterized protein n=1 Tax=Botrytis hyacinthi TaxID=278943 RepID=A0A4Z1GA35_9HELO|nr:hypothetical protein BHYA_0231g00070 [Botrytis hyacinthi]
MPYCPLNVPELPLKTLEPSPRVVDVKKYMENRPDVYLARKTMAPLDAVVTFLWLKDPRYLQQFLNRRCPLFICQIKWEDLHHERSSWEMTVMRQKMSESLHTIELRMVISTRSDDGESIVRKIKLHYITDGHILRFEYHDQNSSDIWPVPVTYATKKTSAATLANLSQLEKVLFYFTKILIEAECNALVDPKIGLEDKAKKYYFVFDGKWKKPEDLIICPRLRSRSLPLIDYYQLEYKRSLEMTKQCLKIFNIRMLPLWRRCICQAPATRVAIDLMETDNTKLKMKNFREGQSIWGLFSGQDLGDLSL